MNINHHHRIRRRSLGRTKRFGYLALAAALTLAACGDDDDDASDDTTAETAPETTEGGGSETTEGGGSETTEGGGSETTEGGGSETTDAPAGASGSATFSTPDLTIDGDITACEIPDETTLSMTVVGENAGFDVTPIDGGVAVTVSGGAEFAGTGQATVSDAGDVSIDGQGSAPDDSATVVDFSVTGTIESC